MKKQNNNLHELKIVYTPGQYYAGNLKVTSSCKAAKLLRKIYDPNTIQCQEEFIILYLDQANNIKGSYKMSKGGMSSTVADVRLILSVGLKCLASGIILSHNHPSGNTQPSDQDIRLTKQLNEACKLLDISLLDHIIMTDSSYFSFVDEKAM